MQISTILTATLLVSVMQVAYSAQLIVPINIVSGNGVEASVGEIRVQENMYGLIFTPDLSNLPVGAHGFHIHQNASCDPMEKDGKKVAALAAGGHWDPLKTNKHAGPYSDGHLGDLPVLHVGIDGNATSAVLAPRLKSLDEIRGHALMVHIGGDNHDDHPAVLGGGGGRLACGVIKK